jgi:hypothetical protein|tara:strand:- start:46 stop:420 length:375 start_codon:yes stop_codon:yes gene_type:complete
MTHFAEIGNDGIVISVIVAEQDFIDNYTTGTWVQTSYNTHGGVHSDGGAALRKNFAGIGMVYDSARDAFYVSKPYNSWTLNDDSCLWVPPIVRPDDTDVDKKYTWDEDVYQGDNTKGWVEVEIV